MDLSIYIYYVFKGRCGAVFEFRATYEAATVDKEDPPGSLVDY
jgi:hypothetical protein